MTKGQQAIREFTRTVTDTTGNLPPLPGIFPDMLAPVVRNTADRRHDGPRVEIAHKGGFIVDLPAYVSEEAAGEIIATEIKLWLKRRVRRDVHEIAAAYEKRFGLKPRGIRVAEFVTGWGSCGQSGTIHIDWRLVFAPKRVLEYVVVHELAHLKHRSHGEGFWALFVRYSCSV